MNKINHKRISSWTTYTLRMSIFERKILHRIYAPICNRGQWQKRYSRELKSFTIVNIIKSSRIRWVGHVEQMHENELPKKTLRTNPGGK
jgi:hypothetical protein